MLVVIDVPAVDAVRVRLCPFAGRVRPDPFWHYSLFLTKKLVATITHVGCLEITRKARARLPLATIGQRRQASMAFGSHTNPVAHAGASCLKFRGGDTGG